MAGGYSRSKDELVAALVKRKRITPSQALECLQLTDWDEGQALCYFDMQVGRVDMREYEWASVDPRSNSLVQYSEADMRVLEREYQTPNYGRQRVPLSIGGQDFTVSLVDKKQFNAGGRGRTIVRVPDTEPDWKAGNVVASMPSGMGCILTGISPLLAPGAVPGDASLNATTSSTSSAGPAASSSSSGSGSVTGGLLGMLGLGSPANHVTMPAWYSIDPRNQASSDYSPADSAAIEASYQTPGYGPDVQLQICGMDFRVNTAEKRQYNRSGGHRAVGRRPSADPAWLAQPVVPAAPAPAASAPPIPRAMASYVSPLNTLGTPGGATGPTFSPHSMSASSSMASMAFSPSAASTASAGDMSDGESDPLKGYHAALDAIQSVDEAVKTVAAKPLDAAALLKLEGVQRVAQMHVLPIYDELLRELRINSDIKRVHGGSANDDSLLDIKLGEPVPAYFANVKNESIYRRKVLSVLGLRNLIPKGTAIFGHMQGTLFSGEEGRYGHAEGLRLMRKLTGNTVDLDDVVLRCDDGMMKMINSANQKGGLPTYGSAGEFSASQQARNIATDAARLILNNFNQQLGLDENQQKQRNVYLPEHYAIPMAHSNSDRAKCPLWHYQNAGQNTFHANAPNFGDIIGSLLLAPWHAIKAYCIVATRLRGEELVKKRCDYFDKCIEDSCFNGKWKSIEAYLTDLSDDLKCTKILGILEQDNQAVFDAIDDEDVYVEEMLKLCQKQRLKALNSTGDFVPITREDIAAHAKVLFL